MQDEDKKGDPDDEEDRRLEEIKDSERETEAEIMAR